MKKPALVALLVLAAAFSLNAQQPETELPDSTTRQTAAPATPSDNGSIVVSRYDDTIMSQSPLERRRSSYKVSKLRIAVDVAYSYRTGRAPEGIDGYLENFIDGMRSGIAYGGDIHYFSSESTGFGGKISGHAYSNSDLEIKDKVRTIYVGPSFMWRRFDRSNRNAFIMSGSLGYVHFIEKTTIGHDGFKLSKGGFGYSFDIGYDIRISGNTFFGLKLALAGGFVPLDTGDSEIMGENLGAIEIGAGLRF